MMLNFLNLIVLSLTAPPTPISALGSEFTFASAHHWPGSKQKSLFPPSCLCQLILKKLMMNRNSKRYQVLSCLVLNIYLCGLNSNKKACR
ncbi:hypothetical protein PT2222_140415 [Paraburkholderia tropica]